MSTHVPTPVDAKLALPPEIGPVAGSATGGRTASNVADVAAEAHEADCACRDCRAARRRTAAVEGLSRYVAAEAPSLERLLRLLDLSGALSDLAALRQIQVLSGENIEALTTAASILERLLDEITDIPIRAEMPMLIAPADQSLAGYFDGAVRWVGARTEDLLNQVRRALVRGHESEPW